MWRNREGNSVRDTTNQGWNSDMEPVGDGISSEMELGLVGLALVQRSGFTWC